MTIYFDYDGESFPFANDTARWTLGEIRAVERWTQRTVQELSPTDQAAVSIGVSIKRVRPTFKLAQIDDMTMEDLGSILERLQEQMSEQEEASQDTPHRPAEKGGPKVKQAS